MLSRRAILSGLLGGAATAAWGHEKWWNGKEVDIATKRLCCSDNDVHHLTREQVALTSDGWRILTTNEVIPWNRTQPSPDGEFWHFFYNGSTACFFAPTGAT